MSSLKLAIAALCLVGVCFIASAVGKTMPDDTDLASLLQDSELANVDDGSIETALLNYLFAKQIMGRLRSNASPQDLIKKRSYWKQCAFNAVSCFGK